MGNCCCETPVTDVKPLQEEPETRIEAAIKFPHGSNGAFFENDQFVQCNINKWISDLYKNKTWTGWLIYNDEPPHHVPIQKGHCKGILTWNDTSVGWLVHSVPRFPSHFTGTDVSIIEPAELLYAQSFMYVERSANHTFLKKVIAQIYHMNATIYMRHNEIVIPQLPHHQMSHLIFADMVIHLAKPAEYHVDIYSEYLTKYADAWQIETWKRGHELKGGPDSQGGPLPQCKDISAVSILGVNYKESQDHSKWAVSSKYFWMGDLNRMETQKKRGGGGFLVKHSGMIEAFTKAIHSHENK